MGDGNSNASGNAPDYNFERLHVSHQVSPSVGAPLHIEGCILSNRIGLGPINSSLFDSDGDISDTKLRFYSQYAEHDAGVVFVGGVAVDPVGRSNRSSLVIAGPSDARGIARIAEAVHAKGSKVAVQLMHAGRQTRRSETGAQPLGATSEPCPVIGEVPQQMTAKDVRATVRSFSAAASAVERAGADLIEIHAAHGYLLSEFIGKRSNSRTDEYRWSNNHGFAVVDDVLSEVREAVGIPVGVRISVRDDLGDFSSVRFLADGIGGLKTKPSFLAISAGRYTADQDIVIPRKSLGQGLWEREARLLKREFDLPTFISGNIDTRETVESLITSGAADAVLVVRAFLADPTFASKILGNSNPRPCIDCRLCKYHSHGYPHVYCPFNPTLVNLLPTLPKPRRA